LTSSRLPNDFVKIITTEEETEEIVENVDFSTANYICHLCKVELNEVEHQEEAGPIICKLCTKKEQIKIERKKGSDGIKKFAEKMLQVNF